MRDEFSQGYLDGLDMTSPEPSGNRHPAYVHSFKIGRAEAMKQQTPIASVSRARAKLIEDNCK